MTREQASTVILTKNRIAFAEIRLSIVAIGLFYSGWHMPSLVPP